MLRALWLRVNPKFDDKRRFSVDCVELDKEGAADYNKVIQDAVGGYYEQVKLRGKDFIEEMSPFVALINEEGLLQNLPINTLATKYIGRKIVGNVLFVCVGPKKDGSVGYRNAPLIVYENARFVMKHFLEDVFGKEEFDLPF